MTHYIIDSKKRQQYLQILLTFIVVSFGLGYIFGYLHGIPAEEIVTVKQENNASSAEKPLSIQPTNVEHNGVNKKNQISNPVAKAKQPEKKKLLKQSQNIKAKQVKTKPIQVNQSIKPKSATLATRSDPTKTVIDKTVAAATPSAPKAESEKNSLQTPNTDLNYDSTSEAVEEDSNQYLVQVGLFANRENASTFVEQLETRGFRASFEEFISTSGVEKYNVRLGPFSKKSVAQEKMSDFEQMHDSSAYILTRK